MLTAEQQAWVDDYDQYEDSQLNERTQDMGRYAQDTGGGDFKQPDPGSHVGRAIRIIDIGTHHGEYQGAATVRNQIILQWELPNELIEVEGVNKPLVTSKFYTNSLSEKANLRKDLEAWRSRAFTPEELMRFDLMGVLGKPCMLSIVHNEKGKAKVVGVSAMPKGMTCPEAFNPIDAFWIDEWNQAKFDALSEGFQKLVMDSDEYKAMRTPPGQRAAAEQRPAVDDDEIPFIVNACMYADESKLVRRLRRHD